jgi:hypothetical protein
MESERPSYPSIRRLYGDILREIFIRVLYQWQTFGSDDNSLNVNTPPWMLSRVYAEWRGVAVQYPELWSFIRINRQDPVVRSLGHLLQLQLARSKSHLLSVYFYSETKQAQPYNALIGIIVGQCHRWQQLSVVASAAYVNQLLAPVKERPVLLELLQLTGFEEDALVPHYSVFSSVPALHAVSYVWDEQAPSFPFRQLQTLITTKPNSFRPF